MVTNEEFEKRIESKWPHMFSKPYGGVAVGPGWYKIVESLCQNIDDHCKWKNMQYEQFGRGAPVEPVIVEQIKEKFGGLRFYYTGGDDYVNGLVDMAESWADETCEDCGAPGQKRSGGWLRTLCDHHEQEYQERRKTNA